MAKKFMDKTNATNVLTEYAARIKSLQPTEITWANYQLLTPEQKAAKRYLIIDYPETIDDVTNKADKVEGATAGNFASLDSNGNLTDSGILATNVSNHVTVSTTNDILVDALLVTSGERTFVGGGSSYTGSLPNSNYQYGIFKVFYRGGKRHVMGLYGETGIIINYYNPDTESWGGWKSVDDIITGPIGVAKGGTGATSLTSGAALIGNGTNAVTTRSITNNTSSSTTLNANTNLVTANTVLNYTYQMLNRTTKVSDGDTSYSTAKARGIYATTTDPGAGSAMTNGQICLVYE